MNLHTFILILHVLGATTIVGIALVTFLIELKKLMNKQMISFIEFIWKIAAAALGIQLLTGLYLSFSEWSNVSKNPFFWLKMVVLFVLGTVVGEINHRHFKALRAGKVKAESGIKWSLIGLLTFLIILTLGVMLAESISA